MPPIFAASARLIPSSAAAIDSNRRLWFACRDDAASRRSSEDVYPSLIVIPFDTARSLHAILNHVSAPLGIPHESAVMAVGISRVLSMCLSAVADGTKIK